METAEFRDSGRAGIQGHLGDSGSANKRARPAEARIFSKITRTNHPPVGIYQNGGLPTTENIELLTRKPGRGFSQMLVPRGRRRTRRTDISRHRLLQFYDVTSVTGYNNIEEIRGYLELWQNRCNRILQWTDLRNSVHGIWIVELRKSNAERRINEYIAIS